MSKMQLDKLISEEKSAEPSNETNEGKKIEGKEGAAGNEVEKQATLYEDPAGEGGRPAVGNLEVIQEGKLLEISESTPVTVATRSNFFFGDSLSEGDGYDSGKPSTGNLQDNQHPRDAPPYDDDDNDSVVSLPAELPPPPDGGWGWVIVIVSFFGNMVVDGVAYSFSPFLDVFSDAFNEPNGKVAWISSLLAGVYLSAGPIVSALTNKFGCRVVCILGALIGSVAYFLTIFANSVEYLMITQGVMAGIGFGLIYLPAVVCVGYYFESKRALATGIAVCGSGVGTMVFPPLVNYLIAEYGWKGTNILIAGMILQCCLFGSLMRPLEVPKMRKKDLLQRLAEEKRAALEAGSICGSTYLTVHHPDGTVERKLKKPYNPDPGVHSHLNLSGYLTPVPTTLALPTIEEAQGGTPPEDESPLRAAVTEEKESKKIEDEEEETDKGDKQSLVNGSGTKAIIQPLSITSPPARVQTTGTQQGNQKIPRNCSQPVIKDGTRFIPKIGSVPNFERKMSKTDLVNAMKVVPATPRASQADLRRVSSGVRRMSSTASFGDPEALMVMRRRSSADRTMMLRPMSRQDIFYSGSIANLKEYKSQMSMLSYRESSLSVQGTGASQVVMDAIDGYPEESRSSLCSCLPESVRGTLSEMMDFSLLRNPVFLLIGVANIFGMLGFYTPFVYLPAAAIEKGVEKSSATLLISIIGITNTVGRVLSGLIADIPRVDALLVNNICIVLSGLCVFLTPFAYSYTSFAVIAVFFGFFVSAYIALTSILLVDLLGLRKLTNSFGLLCIFRGIAGILGPPVSGSIYDATKNYDVSFYCAGGLLFVSAALHFLITPVRRCVDNQQVRYTTNEEYLYDVPEEGESEAGMSPDGGEGIGIVLDIKPKASVVEEDGNETQTVVEPSEEKSKVSSL